MTNERPGRGKKTETDSFAYQALPLLVFILLGFCLYTNTFRVPFTFDDTVNIEENPYLFLTRLDVNDIIAAGFSGPNPHRPVANISFALNYYFHGHSVFGYHLTNIIIHIITGIVLYFLVKETLKSPSLHDRYSRYNLMAFFATAVWFVHPIQTQSVTYIVQRMNSLAAMFYILSLFLYVKGRFAKQQEKNRLLWFIGCAVSGILAFGCKETTATLPIFIFLYEWYFFQDLSGRWLKKRIWYVTGAIIIFGLLGLIYLGSNPLEQILSGYKVKDFTLTERLLSYPRVMVFYISLLGYPVPGRLNIDHDFAVSHSFIAPLSTLPSIVLIIVLFVSGIYLARKERLVSFCIFWFLGNLVIESTVIALQLVFEHRLYLPSMFVSAALAGLVWRWIKPRWVRVAVFSIAAIIFCVWTYERNGVWSDPVSLWKDCVSKSPRKARAYNGLGLALLSGGKVGEAAAEFRRALSIKPDYFKAHNNLGLALGQAGRTDEAIASFNEALKFKPNCADAYSNIGNIFRSEGKLEEAIQQYRKALAVKPDHIEAHGNLCAVLEESGRHKEQIEWCRKILRARPSDATARYNLANALAEEGRLDEAIQEYKAAIRSKSNYSEAYNNLGNALIAQGKGEQAIDAYRQALKIDPDFASAHYNLAITLAEKDRPEEAIEEYREAIRLKDDYFNAHNNLAALLARMGRPEEAIIHFSKALKLRPFDVGTHNNLGIVLVSMGEMDEAVKHFRQALEIDANDADTHYNLAITFEKLGEDDEAIAHYRRTLELNPNHIQARKRLRKAKSVNE